MSWYLGNIEIKNFFTNFKPIYLYENDQFDYLSPQNKQELLPESKLGNINFYSDTPGYNVEDNFSDGEYILFQFELEDLQPRTSSSGERLLTGYKIDISRVANKKIKRLSDLGYYQLIDNKSIHEDFRKKEVLPIEGIGLYSKQEVILHIEDLLIGPYKVQRRNVDNQYIINTHYENNKYLVKGLKNGKQGEMEVQKFGTFDNERSYIKVSDDYEECNLDVITPERLLESFNESISKDFLTNDGKLDLKNIDGLLQHYNKSLLIGDLPSEIQLQRMEKIRILLTDEENLQETFDFIAETISGLLIKYKDKDVFNSLINSLSNNNEFMIKIQSFKIIKDRIEELKSKEEEISANIAILNEEIKNKKSHDIVKDILVEHNSEIERKENEISELENKLASLRELLQIHEDGKNQQERFEKLKQEVEYKERRERELDENIKKIETRLDSKFEISTEKVMDFAFDPMLANKMFEQASKWENQNKNKDFSSIAEKIVNFQVDVMKKDDLISYICEQVNVFRPDYDKNTIINIMICITQGFLTVFSGEPGTGKTSICNILAHILGLTLPKNELSIPENEFNPNRYVSVSVERGWTTKRDFIGYYNPLSKTFDKNNRRVFEAFKILDYEAKEKIAKLPYLMLLDEANLSPMEYYWADFMNVCDDLNDNSCINLGENYYFSIPRQLRFLATINNDHTTETFSPRLVDRAWTVTLPITNMGTARSLLLDNYNGIKKISWDSILNTFGGNEFEIPQIFGVAKNIYDTILTKFRENKTLISSRSDIAIRRYWSVAQQLFENETDYGMDASIVALDYAVKQRVLTQISGSGKKYKEFLESLLEICKDRNLRQSEEILGNIITKGDDNMEYYQFFQ